MLHRLQRSLSALRRWFSAPAKSECCRTRLAVEMLERRDCPAVYTWTGAGMDSLASDAANWSGFVVPGAADTAILNATSNKPIEFNAAFGTSLAQLQIQSGYGGTVQFDVPFTITNYLLQANGTIANASGSTGGTGGMGNPPPPPPPPGGGTDSNGVPGTDSGTGSGGHSSGPVTLEIASGATYNWSGGWYTGTGTLQIDAGTTVNMASTMGLSDSGWNITNSGTVLWAAGTFFASNVAFNNNAGATFSAQGNLTWSDPATAGGVFTNDGTLTVSGNVAFVTHLVLDAGTLNGNGVLEIVGTCAGRVAGRLYSGHRHAPNRHGRRTEHQRRD